MNTKIIDIIKEIDLPFAYHHFAEGESPEPPFLIYLYPSADNFAADGKAYYKKNVVHLEAYTDFKDIKTENKIESVLDNNNIFYSKSEVYIESEKLYEVLYSFEMEN